MANVVRHAPEVYFEAQGTWPAEPVHDLDYVRWSTTVDESAPDPEPEDLSEPCGQAFPDEEPMPF
jgi:hypothetical protein